ncbi:DHA2 family efflux MFS transporter permease subunit [Rubrobacter indicoceani]|uniref:DHA2 family efflux MFS transporter permease subunit n=1 Tax=Rubrobacter indicoceani TaxID=2051957 RepID=UPI000E5ADE1E|nr:DHA2 family efflux MFS transporter permease subunit [Rubrobacter indicoceani]
MNSVGGVSSKWLVLSAVSVGTFMATLNTSIVNVSLPTIAADLGVAVTEVEWIVIAYLLSTGVLLLTFGRLGDVLGYHRLYVAGFAVFAVAGTVCGFAGGIGTLTGLRVVQGIGAAAVQAVGPAIVSSTFDDSERGKALGINAISVSVGLALGPTLGGLIAEVLSWRWIFFINFPIGVIGLVWVMRVLPRSSTSSDQTFDPTGAVIAGGMLFALLFALVEGADLGWSSPTIITLLALALVLFIAFIVVELRMEQPMFDLRLFAVRPFAAGSFSLLVAFVALLSALYLMPFFLQNGQGLTVLQAGLLITPLSLTTLVVAPFSGALSDRIGTTVLPTVGLGFIALGVFSLTTMDAGTTGLGVVWRMVLIGFGLGVFNSPNQSAIIGSVPRRRLGTASGTIAQMRITGQVLGVAASGAILSARIPEHLRELSGSLPEAAARSEAIIYSVHEALYFSAAVALVGALASLVRRGYRRKSPPPQAQAGTIPGAPE